jgi:hypothetical protein
MGTLLTFSVVTVHFIHFTPWYCDDAEATSDLRILQDAPTYTQPCSGMRSIAKVKNSFTGPGYSTELLAVMLSLSGTPPSEEAHNHALEHTKLVIQALYLHRDREAFAPFQRT